MDCYESLKAVSYDFFLLQSLLLAISMDYLVLFQPVESSPSAKRVFCVS